MTTNRTATRFLTYRGDQRHIVTSTPHVGPTEMGELLYPVTAEYDEKTDKTRVGFSYIAPAVTR